MTMFADYPEERLGELLRALPAPPSDWVTAAQQLPALRRALEDLVQRARRDQRFRQALLADVESALRDAGYSPEPRLVAALRERL
jgi:hypothetical protein